MKKNYIIKNGPSYWLAGSSFHNTYTFEPNQAARFTEFGATLKVIEINKEECEVIEIK